VELPVPLCAVWSVLAEGRREEARDPRRNCVDGADADRAAIVDATRLAVSVGRVGRGGRAIALVDEEEEAAAAFEADGAAEVGAETGADVEAGAEEIGDPEANAEAAAVQREEVLDSLLFLLV
jgi:hypothetical protein